MVFAFIFVNNHKLNLPLVCATRDPTRRREQSPPRGHPGYLGGYFGISSKQSKRPQFARPRTVPSLNPFATELQNIPSTSHSRLRACFPFFLASHHSPPSTPGLQITPGCRVCSHTKRGFIPHFAITIILYYSPCPEIPSTLKSFFFLSLTCSK